MQGRSHRWRAILAATAAAAMLPASAGAATPAEIDAAVAGGAAFLASQQQADGSIDGFNSDWAVMSLAAAGIHAADLRAGAGASLQDWAVGWHAANPYGIDYGAIPSAQSTQSLAKAVLIARAAGVDPARVSPAVNLVASLASLYDHVGGTFGNRAANSDGFAALALADLDGIPRSLVHRVVQGTRAAQHADGGWSISPTAGAGTDDVDMTGAGLAVLCRAGGADASDPQVSAGLAWLQARIDEPTGAFANNGPWVPRLNTPSNAWALSGLNACGVDVQGPTWTTARGEGVVDWLLAMQREDGSFKYQPSDGATAPQDVNATEAAIRALAGAAFSADPPARANPVDPTWRPAPTVAPGTPVPVAIAIEDGTATPRFCAVVVPDGTPLSEALVAARDRGSRSDCVEEVAVADDGVTSLNGVAPGAGSAWHARVDGQDVGRAGEQEIGFGDVVWLHVAASPTPTPPSTPTPTPPSTPTPTPPSTPVPTPDPDSAPVAPEPTPPPVQGAPSQTPPPAAAPTRVALEAPRRVTVGRRGRLPFVVSCPTATAEACTATVRVRVKVKRRWRTIDRLRVVVPAGEQQRVRVTIGKRLLRSAPLKLRLVPLVDGKKRGPALKVRVRAR